MTTADDDMHQCELHLDDCDVFLRAAAESVNAELGQVTQSIREHSHGLQKKKDDLQQHIDMTVVHMEVTEETLERLSKAIADKELAMNGAVGRLELHSSRCPSDAQRQTADRDIGQVLHRELVTARAELEDLLDQVPALEACQRALRRSQLQLGREIAETIQCLAIEELKCLVLRNAHNNPIHF